MRYAVALAFLVLGLAGCGGESERVGGAAAPAGTNKLVQGAAAAKRLAASAQVNASRAARAAEEVHRCTAGRSRTIGRFDRCYKSAVAVGQAMRDAARDGELATTMTFVIASAACEAARELRGKPGTQVVGSACTAAGLAQVALDTVSQIVLGQKEAAWYRGAWTTVLVDSVAKLADEIAETADEVTVNVVETVTEVRIETADEAEAAAAAGESIVDQIKNGVITAVDAIRQGLISCQEAKDADVYPDNAPCP